MRGCLVQCYRDCLVANSWVQEGSQDRAMRENGVEVS